MTAGTTDSIRTSNEIKEIQEELVCKLESLAVSSREVGLQGAGKAVSSLLGILSKDNRDARRLAHSADILPDGLVEGLASLISSGKVFD